MHEDLRGFLEAIDRRRELKTIRGADPELEMGALTVIVGKQSKNHPAVLFDEVKGFKKGFRVLTNAISTLARSKLALGLDPDAELSEPALEIAKMLSERRPYPPREVSDGPVMENVQRGDEVDLLRFPAPRWHMLDGGGYIGTGTLVVMKDPETGKLNVGTYRLQLHDGRTMGIMISPGHHGGIIREKYWERGRSCPVAISLGHDPTLASAAEMRLPWGESEYDQAGLLRGGPVDVIVGPLTGLPFPSRSEMVVEGEIPPPSEESHKEGPFGEFGGYYSADSKPQPVVRVKAVYHRDDPVLLGSPPFRGVRHDGVLPIADALLLLSLQRGGFPEVRKIGRAGPFLAVSVKVRYAAHARGIAEFLMSGAAMRPPKFVVVFDEDVDPTNPEDVFSALQSRVDAEDSVHLVRNRWGSPTDPRIPPDKKDAGDITASSLIFDATRPWAWRDSFPKQSDFPRDMLDQYRKKWSRHLG